MSGKLLNRHQAANRLGISESMVAALRQRGALVAIKVGRVYKYRLNDLDQFIRTNSVNVPEPMPEPLPPVDSITADSPLGLIAYALLAEVREQRRQLVMLAQRRAC